MARRLVRNTRKAVLAGVAAGFADYFDVDPVLARLAFILLTFAGGFGLFLYFLSWVLMPRPEEVQAEPAAPGAPPVDRVVEEVRKAGEKVVEELKNPPAGVGRGRLLGGLILIVLGSLLLLDRFMPFGFLWIVDLWPVILILVGAALILGARRGTAT